MSDPGRASPDLDVPEVVRNKAIDAGAVWWLDSLPALIGELEREWSIEVGSPYRDPTEAYVAEATLADGTPAVLKLVVPREHDVAANEITVLRHADGDGCARLFRSDAGRSAPLLERLGPSLHELGLPLAQRIEILCAAAIRVWRPAPDAGLPTGAAKGRWLIDFVTTTWEDLDRRCTERAVAHALACDSWCQAPAVPMTFLARTPIAPTVR